MLAMAPVDMAAMEDWLVTPTQQPEDLRGSGSITTSTHHKSREAVQRVVAVAKEPPSHGKKKKLQSHKS